MTECCGKISMSLLPEGAEASLTPASQLDLVCTSGRPFSLIDLRIVREDGTDIEPESHEVGEVLVRYVSKYQT